MILPLTIQYTDRGLESSIEATVLHPGPRDLEEENNVIRFEGEIEVGAETKELVENQAYAQLSHLGEVTVEALKKVQHNRSKISIRNLLIVCWNFLIQAFSKRKIENRQFLRREPGDPQKNMGQ